MASSKKTKLTPLCRLAYKYGTDKCPQIGHLYTPVYYQLFKDKRLKIKKVLELGIGSRETMQWVPDQYQKGASLLMWRDFFPKAQIYGVDISPTAVFQDKRITTFLLDTRNRRHLEKLTRIIGTDLDLVIDDGPHNETAQLRTIRFLLPLLQKNCLYIIEDVARPEEVAAQLNEYRCRVAKFTIPNDHKNALVIVKNK